MKRTIIISLSFVLGYMLLSMHNKKNIYKSIIQWHNIRRTNAILYLCYIMCIEDISILWHFLASYQIHTHVTALGKQLSYRWYVCRCQRHINIITVAKWIEYYHINYMWYVVLKLDQFEIRDEKCYLHWLLINDSVFVLRYMRKLYDMCYSYT